MTLAPSASLGRFVTSNLLVASGQRRYAIKRSERPAFLHCLRKQVLRFAQDDNSVGE
jgi:hypothetical protein